MPDILIRDVPDAVLASIDSRAAELGLTRPEFLRRRLAQEAMRSQVEVTFEQLLAASQMAQDLADPDIMARAWE